MPLQRNDSGSLESIDAVGDEDAVVLPTTLVQQPSVTSSEINHHKKGQQSNKSGSYAVEVSGGNNNENGIIPSSIVTSTMFAERHTKSILSDETLENQNPISREHSHVVGHNPVITGL